MSSAGAALSNQDLEDLNEIRSRLPQGDPRASKILTLVGQHAQEPTQFERERAPSEGSVLERGASGAWSGLKAMNPFQGGFKGALENAGEMASGVAIPHAIANAYQGYKEGRNQGQGVLPSIAGAVGGATGLDVSGIRERAAKGDVAGVVGEGIPAVASTLAAPEIGKVGEAAKEGAQSLGKSMRDPYTQKLTPRTQAAAKLLGGAAGSVTGAVTGGPWGAVSGGYAGYRAMPSLAELLVPKQDVGQFSKIPERMPKPAVPPTNVPELGTPENPGFFAKLPTRMPKPAVPPTNVPELGTPENPGFFAKLPTRMPRTASAAPTKLPSTFMMTAPEPQRMAAIPQIGGEGSTGATITPTTPKNISFVGPGDKIAAPKPPGPALGSPENPGWSVKLPGRMPKVAAEEQKLDNIVTPERAAAERSAPRVGSEGSAARWTNNDAMRILRDSTSSMADKREAAMTLGRRGIELPENYRYLAGNQAPGSVVYNPRNVTRFTAGGESVPIKQGGKWKPMQ